MEKKGSNKVIWVVFFSATLMAGLIYWKIRQAPAPGGPPGAGPGGKSGPQKVSACIAQSEVLPLKQEFSGSLLAWNEVQLVPEMAGRVVKFNLKEGRMVQEGEILLILFDEDLRAQEDKLKLQETITSRNLERSRALLKTGSGTQQEADNAENQLNNIRADLRILQASLKKTSIRAPFFGQVGLCNVSPGAYVSPGNPLAWLRDTRRLKLEFSVPEAWAGIFQVGNTISFSSGNASDTLTANIYALDPGLDPSTRNLSIRAEVANPGGKLLPGTFVRVWPSDAKIQKAIMLPTQTIIPDNRGKKVIVCRNGKAQFCPVETGIRTLSKIQILKGIQPGDTVLTSGLMFVKPESGLIITRIENQP
jgi:membrane fusion protein (multidrug efflux system)